MNALVSSLIPYDISGHSRISVGVGADLRIVSDSAISKTQTLVSVGLSDTLSFERAFAERYTELKLKLVDSRQIDVSSLPGQDRVSFSRLTVGRYENTINEIVDGLRDVTLRIDIGGAEYVAFLLRGSDSYMDLSHVLMLVVDLHGVASHSYNYARRFMEIVGRQMTLFSASAVQGSSVSYLDGYPISDDVTLTFINNSLVSSRVRQHDVPQSVLGEVSVRTLDPNNHTAFCYVTDGRDSPEMRRLSIRSLRRHCPDVDVYTCTAGGISGKSADGEEVLDLTRAFSYVYPHVDPLSRCNKDNAYPSIVFGKFVVPYIEELHRYDRLVVIDPDTEIVSAAFGGLKTLEIPDEAFVGLVGYGTLGSPIERAHRRFGLARTPCYSTGLVLLRGHGSRPEDIRQLRMMYAAFRKEGFMLPEEYASNLYLPVFSIPDAYHTIPALSASDMTPAREAALRAAYAFHYPGGRKQAVMDRWRRQYEDGNNSPVDIYNLTGTNA